MTNLQINAVDGSPTKGFVIDILTRDISLIAAILDLVDNSIDSANLVRQNGNLEGIELSIVANRSGFSIQDNCGGITVAHARDYVFRMGRPEGTKSSPNSIGQFGVGMKRALFKLGSAFIVSSETALERFSVKMNVAQWMLQDQDWSLPIAVEASEASSNSGTYISVSPLWESVEEAFENQEFEDGLRDELRSRHRLAIGNGLKIILNGVEVKAADSKIALSSLLRPSVRTFTVPSRDGGELEVKIVVGVAPVSDPSISEDDEPEAQSHPAADAGWLVFGNGRLLLANDKSKITGWGSGKKKIPQFHNQYSRFRGFVYMTAADASVIPWNTMKTGVDSDSPIWVSVRNQMIEAARSIIDMLNMAKVERQFAVGDMSTPISDAIRSASSADALAVFDVEFSMTMGELRAPSQSDAVYPEPNHDLIEAWKKIQYSVQTDHFEELAKAIGITSAAEIGRMSFDAFHETNVRSE